MLFLILFGNVCGLFVRPGLTDKVWQENVKAVETDIAVIRDELEQTNTMLLATRVALEVAEESLLQTRAEFKEMQGNLKDTRNALAVTLLQVDYDYIEISQNN